MTLDTKRLREIATAANPEHPWYAAEDLAETFERLGDIGDDAEADAAFVAAVSPAVVVGLLDEVERLRAQVAFLEQDRDAALDEMESLREPKSDCGCFTCVGDRPTRPGSWLTVGMTQMIVCTKCGNKRCPHGTDHKHECTGSNEPGQVGSRYGGTP